MKKLLSCLLLFLIIAGCSNEQSFEPVEINPEVDVCEVCNMSLSNKDYATQLFSKDGDVFLFDDIGCMFEYIDKDQQIAREDIEVQYVRDLKTTDWIQIENAYFVYNPDVWTPMANGVVSFGSEESANEFVQEQGKGEVLNYEQLLEHKWGWEG